MVGRIAALSEPLRTSLTPTPCMCIARLTMYSPRPLPLPLLSPLCTPPVRASRSRRPGSCGASMPGPAANGFCLMCSRTHSPGQEPTLPAMPDS